MALAHKAQRAINYATRFYSTGRHGVLDSVTESKLFSMPEVALVSKLRWQKLQKAFSALSKRDQKFMGGIYGALDYEKVSVTELAIRNLLTESCVEKAKNCPLEVAKTAP